MGTPKYILRYVSDIGRTEYKGFEYHNDALEFIELNMKKKPHTLYIEHANKDLTKKLADSIEELLGTCELNLDEIDDETTYIISTAQSLLERVKGKV